MKHSLNNQTLIIFVLFGLALLAAYSIYQPFVLPISIAALLVMATFNLTQYFVDKTGSKKFSTLIMVSLLILLILAPIFYIGTEGVSYIVKFDKETITKIVANTKELVSDDPYIVYSGCIQGRHIRELGAKGCFLVSVENGEVQELKEYSLDVFRWFKCILQIENCDEMLDV